MTKIDVLDNLKEIKICTGYQYRGEILRVPPVNIEVLTQCEPIYEAWPGWLASTEGITQWEQLPVKAMQFLNRISELAGVPM